MSERRDFPDTNVIDFLQRIPKQRRDEMMFRAYGRHRQRQHRMREAAKRSEDEGQE